MIKLSAAPFLLPTNAAKLLEVCGYSGIKVGRLDRNGEIYVGKDFNQMKLLGRYGLIDGFLSPIESNDENSKAAMNSIAPVLQKYWKLDTLIGYLNTELLIGMVRVSDEKILIGKQLATKVKLLTTKLQIAKASLNLELSEEEENKLQLSQTFQEQQTQQIEQVKPQLLTPPKPPKTKETATKAKAKSTATKSTKSTKTDSVTTLGKALERAFTSSKKQK